MSTRSKTHRTKRAQTSKLHRGIAGEPSIHPESEQIKGFKCTDTDPAIPAAEEAKKSEIWPYSVRLAMLYSRFPKPIKAMVSLFYFAIVKIQKRLTRPCNP